MWRKGFARVTEVSALLAELLMLVLMVLVVVEIVCRGFLGFSLLFVDEVAGYFLVAILFLGVSVSFRSGSLLRVEFILQNLPQAWRQWLEVVYHLIAFAVVVIIDYALIKLVLSTYSREMHAPTLLATPLYIPQLVMPIGTTLLAIAVLAAGIEKLFAAAAGRDEVGDA